MNDHGRKQIVTPSCMGELEGYLELGMTTECLGLARKMLKTPRLTAEEFCACLGALCTLADKLKPWRFVVERGFKALRRRDNEARLWMFRFYVSLSDWDNAHQVMPRRGLNDTDLLFAMWVHLNRNEMEAAGHVYRKCRRQARRAVASGQNTEDVRFTLSASFEAEAVFHARRRDWGRAQAAWEMGLALQPFGVNAFEGLVKIHALRAYKTAQFAHEAIQRPGYWEGVESLMLPGNEKEVVAECLARFERYRKRLERVVPGKDRREFGE